MDRTTSAIPTALPVATYFLVRWHCDSKSFSVECLSEALDRRKKVLRDQEAITDNRRASNTRSILCSRTIYHNRL